MHERGDVLMPGPGCRINVDQSMRVAKGDFDYIDELDYGEFGAGMCAEGHPIRYGHEFRSRSTGESVILGGDCQWKVYLFRQWENIHAEEITKELIKIGKVFWTIQKDHYWDEIKEIMRRENVTMDFSTIPQVSQQQQYRLTLRDFLGKAIAQRTARENAEKARRERERKESSRTSLALSDKDVAELNSITCPSTSSCDDETVRKSLVDAYVKYGRWSEGQRILSKNLVVKCKDEQYVNLCNCNCAGKDVEIQQSLILNRRRGNWSVDQRGLVKKIIERNKPRERAGDFEIKKEFLLAMMRMIAKSATNDREKQFLLDVHDMIDDGISPSDRQRGWLVGIIDTFQAKTGGALAFDTHEFIKSL